jgi:hypothetical protein
MFLPLELAPSRSNITTPAHTLLGRANCQRSWRRTKGRALEECRLVIVRADGATAAYYLQAVASTFGSYAGFRIAYARKIEIEMRRVIIISVLFRY